MNTTQAFFDSLSKREGALCERIMEALSGEPWAGPLLRAITDAGGVCRENKSLLFELRFANALHECGIAPEYEIPGEGESTLDFGFSSRGRDWAVELMRLEETAAVRSATHTSVDSDGVSWISRALSSSAPDARQSEEGETLKAIERICQKCERNGQPHKFPVPNSRLQAILVDFRTFLHGGDKADRIHVALGGKYLRSGFFRRYWDGVLITGVFDDGNRLRGAREARERVHFIGFVDEQNYEAGDFGTSTQFVANPHLFRSEEEVRDAIASWPLARARVLNLRAA